MRRFHTHQTRGRIGLNQGLGATGGRIRLPSTTVRNVHAGTPISRAVVGHPGPHLDQAGPARGLRSRAGPRPGAAGGAARGPGVARMEADRSSRASCARSRRVASAQASVRTRRGNTHPLVRPRGDGRPGAPAARQPGGPTASRPDAPAAAGARARAKKQSDLCSSDRATHSSRCSMPSLETLASVISSGIQSGLSAGASSSQAQPS
jgi:hypothetical protein